MMVGTDQWRAVIGTFNCSNTGIRYPSISSILGALIFYH